MGVSLDDRPWYRKTVRWGQTNLTEIDPVRYDSAFWREQWRATKAEGVIVNAAGIVTYYPSQFREVHRAEYLGDKDLFGEVVSAAREEGLVVLARMDSNRVHHPFFVEHKDWCALDKDGRPYMAGGLYVTCVSSPYYFEFLPEVFREIIRLYRPDGITDNSWSGLGRQSICYCRYCMEGFKRASSFSLPQRADYDDPVYRRWILWSYDQRLRVLDKNNAVTKSAGGPHCLWLGMNSGSVIHQSRMFRDLKAICERSEIIMLDHQTRHTMTGFHINAEAGRLIHGLLGEEKLIPESMSMYQSGDPTFRIASKPQAEAQLWMVEGFAGGIQPWWHHIGAYHEDRRQYATAQPLMEWHEKNQEYLLDREPVADVGVLFSQRNVDFYGRDQADTRVLLPYSGVTHSMLRSRISYVPLHIDNLDRQSRGISAVVLPAIGVISDAQAESLRHFVEDGGSIIASGQTGFYNEAGDLREDSALADLFGIHVRHASHGSMEGYREFGDYSAHSYLRLHPEAGFSGEGSVESGKPNGAGVRHRVLDGFEETDVLPFGGRLELVETDEDVYSPLSYIPEFPIYPPETSYMRVAQTSLPALTLKEHASGSKCIYMAADIDRCYGRHHLPDHYRLLCNLIDYAISPNRSIQVGGRGLIDCRLYRQKNRLILHIVNLTNDSAWTGLVHETVPTGPFEVRISSRAFGGKGRVDLRVSGERLEAESDGDYMVFLVPQVDIHEMAVII